MGSIIFAKRNIKEILRDPISVFFSLIFPIFLLVIFQSFNIPESVYRIENFAPGIIIFGFSFITLFTSTLVSKDKSTSFLTRLYSSPLKMKDYILGYIFALIPIAVLQSLLFLLTTVFYGVNIDIKLLLTIMVSLPISILFICLGIFFGTIFNDKAAPGLSSIVVQLVAFTSGLWFNIDQVGGVFKTICNLLPFKYTVDILRSIFNGTKIELINYLILFIYIIIIFIITSILFKRKTLSDK